MQVLKRIHLKFDPIVCLTPDSSLLYFYPCPDFLCDGTCNVFSIRKRVPYGKRVPFNSVQQAYCESCYVEARKNDVGCDKERNQRTAPNSHVPILSLTNGEKVEKIHCLIDERRKYVREERVHAAKTRMEKPVLTVSELSDEWQEVLSRTMTMIRNQSEAEHQLVKRDLVSSILEASTDRKHSKIPWKSDEANQFTEFILSEMKNKAQVMSGRDTTVQFSLGILRTSLTLYLRSQVGYNELKETSPLSLPSVRTLRKLQAKMKLSDGYNPTIYGWFFDETVQGDKQNSNNLLHGHLIVDEMKLKTGIYWRSSDHKACGFALCSSTMSLTDSIRDMIQDEEKENDEKMFQEKYAPAIYVNQWCFRSTYNVIHNAEFFFNTGSLDGNDMLHQLIHVMILSYELIGVQILGLVSDAGGINAGLIRLLRSGQRSKHNQPETNAALASFSNPFDPSRRIAIWLCSTHNLKSIRNQLLASAGSINSPRLILPQWRHVRMESNL